MLTDTSIFGYNVFKAVWMTLGVYLLVTTAMPILEMINTQLPPKDSYENIFIIWIWACFTPFVSQFE